METLYNVACRRGCHWTHMLLERTWYVDKPETPRNTGENCEGQRDSFSIVLLIPVGEGEKNSVFM